MSLKMIWLMFSTMGLVIFGTLELQWIYLSAPLRYNQFPFSSTHKILYHRILMIQSFLLNGVDLYRPGASNLFVFSMMHPTKYSSFRLSLLSLGWIHIMTFLATERPSENYLRGFLVLRIWATSAYDRFGLINTKVLFGIVLEALAEFSSVRLHPGNSFMQGSHIQNILRCFRR